MKYVFSISDDYDAPESEEERQRIENDPDFDPMAYAVLDVAKQHYYNNLNIGQVKRSTDGLLKNEPFYNVKRFTFFVVKKTISRTQNTLPRYFS